MHSPKIRLNFFLTEHVKTKQIVAAAQTEDQTKAASTEQLHLF